jgi:putative inorganic carbon (HCO3(-)) transporter
VVSAILAVGATALLLVFIRWARPDAGIADAARWSNHVHGLHAWTDGLWPILIGRGSGAVWPWLGVELGRAAAYPGQVTMPSPWGELLWHPHSTVLGVLVELGLVGVLLLVISLGAVLICAARVLHDPDPGRWLPAAALIATAPGMLLETYLFRGFPAALVWWTVALCVVRWGGSDLARRAISALRRP